MSTAKISIKNLILLAVAIIIPVVIWALPTSAFGIEALTATQQRVIALFVFAALMWIFEVVPNWTTSVLVIVLSLLMVSNKGLGFLCTPEAGELVNFKSLMSSFADPVVMLFLGGFVLAIMAEKYGLDVTLARILLLPFGKKPKFVLLGFLIVISIFSMFMSNTATAAMMLAFLAPVLAALPKDDKGRIGLALSIPIAANIGGIGTPIGTPPNATAVGYLAQAGIEVSFVDWMLRMVPYVVIMIIIAWVLLQVFFPFKSKEVVLNIPENKAKKDWKYYTVWVTFLGTILLWVFEQVHGVNSNVVALIPLGVLTVTGIFTKEDIAKINWSVLWLVAGGFALGTALQGTGLAKVLINAIPFSAMSVVLVLVIAGLVCYFLSNFISNSATAALLIPILIVVAQAMADPEAANNASFVALGGTQAMIIFIAVCASIAMLFPISTPPNAIAASTGLVETKDMAKLGIIIGVIGFVLGFFWLTKIFPFGERVKEDEGVKIVAHRGYWNCDEAGKARNSIASLRCAQEAGFWGSEFDVNITADTVLVVFHDGAVEGREFADYPFSEFAADTLKNGESIPTLDEYLTQGEKASTVLVFELKTQKTEELEDLLLDKSYEALKAHNLMDPKKVVFISFSRHICDRIAKECPEYTNQYLHNLYDPKDLAETGINGIDFHYSWFEEHPDWYQQARDNKMSVNCWTVNKEEDMQKMIEMGVDYITTDKPHVLKELLAKESTK